MGAKSNHYGDLVRWIEQVIDSCTTRDQINTAHALLELADERFRQQLGSDHFDVKMSLISKLHLREEKIWEKAFTEARKKYERDSDEGNLS